MELVSNYPSTSSKVYIRYFDYTAYYEIDRVLPSILDSTVTNEEWIAFCDNIDACFQGLNSMQCINFYVDVMIGLVVIFYLVMAYLIYLVRPGMRFIYAILFIAAVNTIFHIYVRGPANTFAVRNAKDVCGTETTRLNLRAGHATHIDLVFHYRKRFCWNCEGYELDRNQKQRYHEIYVEVTVRRHSPGVGYGGETTATATVVDECYNTTDLANAPIATATEISTDPNTNHQEHSPYVPYVTAATPPMASAQFLNSTEDEPEAQQQEEQENSKNSTEAP